MSASAIALNIADWMSLAKLEIINSGLAVVNERLRKPENLRIALLKRSSFSTPIFFNDLAMSGLANTINCCSPLTLTPTAL